MTKYAMFKRVGGNCRKLEEITELNSIFRDQFMMVDIIHHMAFRLESSLVPL